VLANASFYQTFQVNRENTEGWKIYDIGNGQWKIKKLRLLLEKIIPQNQGVDDYEVTHDFEHIGPKVMLLNARQIIRQDNRQKVLLLAIEDITLHKQLEQQTKDAETEINDIFEKLVGSSMRISGGTAPQERPPKKRPADFPEEPN
jgi:hypothetical protein